MPNCGSKTPTIAYLAGKMSIGYELIITTGEGVYTSVDARNQHYGSNGTFLKKRNVSRFGLARRLGLLFLIALSFFGMWGVLKITDVIS